MEKTKRRMIERQNFFTIEKDVWKFRRNKFEQDSDCLSVNTTTFEGLESRDGCEDSLRNAVRVQ